MRGHIGRGVQSSGGRECSAAGAGVQRDDAADRRALRWNVAAGGRCTSTSDPAAPHLGWLSSKPSCGHGNSLIKSDGCDGCGRSVPVYSSTATATVAATVTGGGIGHLEQEKAAAAEAGQLETAEQIEQQQATSEFRAQQQPPEHQFMPASTTPSASSIQQPLLVPEQGTLPRVLAPTLDRAWIWWA
eukprot:COSAG06_NODE_21362_length_759_cov_1.857576_1_plen_186_part_10